MADGAAPEGTADDDAAEFAQRSLALVATAAASAPAEILPTESTTAASPKATSPAQAIYPTAPKRPRRTVDVLT